MQFVNAHLPSNNISSTHLIEESLFLVILNTKLKKNIDTLTGKRCRK